MYALRTAPPSVGDERIVSTRSEMPTMSTDESVEAGEWKELVAVALFS